MIALLARWERPRTEGKRFYQRSQRRGVQTLRASGSEGAKSRSWGRRWLLPAGRQVTVYVTPDPPEVVVFADLAHDIRTVVALDVGDDCRHPL